MHSARRRPTALRHMKIDAVHARPSSFTYAVLAQRPAAQSLFPLSPHIPHTDKKMHRENISATAKQRPWLLQQQQQPRQPRQLRLKLQRFVVKADAKAKPSAVLHFSSLLFGLRAYSQISGSVALTAWRLFQILIMYIADLCMHWTLCLKKRLIFELL